MTKEKKMSAAQEAYLDECGRAFKEQSDRAKGWPSILELPPAKTAEEKEALEFFANEITKAVKIMTGKNARLRKLPPYDA